MIHDARSIRPDAHALVFNPKAIASSAADSVTVVVTIGVCAVRARRHLTRCRFPAEPMQKFGPACRVFFVERGLGLVVLLRDIIEKSRINSKAELLPAPIAERASHYFVSGTG